MAAAVGWGPLPRAFLARVVAVESVRELIPFYPVYAVLFADTGLSTSEISWLFVLWSVVALLAEVPSGALADVRSRRALLVVGALGQGVAFGLWAAVPTYPSFAAGFVLWGLAGALVSGTSQAYVYDTLQAHGRTAAYPKVVARSRAGGLLAALLATVAAAPLLGAGGYHLVGAATVLACLAQAGLAASLPPDRRLARGHPDRVVTGYLETLRAGVQEAHRALPVRRAVLLVALLAGLMCFDEYFPLVAIDLGAERTLVPVLMAATVALQAAGALLGEHCPPGLVVPALTAGALLTTAGSLAGDLVGFAALAAGFGLLQTALVVAETRLQEVIGGAARATVTSVAGLLSELVAIGSLMGFALGGAWLSLPVLVAVTGLLLLPVAALASAQRERPS